jgi:uncharacterized protein YbaP (TraB family)
MGPTTVRIEASNPARKLRNIGWPRETKTRILIAAQSRLYAAAANRAADQRIPAALSETAAVHFVRCCKGMTFMKKSTTRGLSILGRCRALGLLLLFAQTPMLFAAGDRGLIYRVGGGDVYLLGSIHMATSDFYPLRAAIETAFAQADTLAVELNINAIDPVRLQSWIAQHGVYPPGETLRDHLRPETWRRLQDHLQQQHLDAGLIAHQKPGLVVIALSAAQLGGIGFSPALGIDAHFLDQAGAQHKNIVELESLEQQLTLLSTMPDADLLIGQAIDQASALNAAMDALCTAWKRGDADALANFLLNDDLRAHPEYRALFDRLYTQRNRAMAARIQEFLTSGKRYFVVVGAAHLIGAEGIVALLKRDGIAVEQW